MDYSKTKLPSRPFDVAKGQNDDKDRSDLSFRVPSIPNSPSSSSSTPSQSESVRQRSHDLVGSSNGK